MPTQYVTQTSDRSKKTALLLCIFLGFLGAHQFYVGRIGKGILYLFTAGLFVFGWIIDIFKILTGQFRDNVGVPLRQ
jgi:restriction system protein